MAYRLYLHPNEYQEDVLNSLLTARYHLAQLAGFKTYSARANTGTMMGSPGLFFNVSDVWYSLLLIQSIKCIAYKTALTFHCFFKLIFVSSINGNTHYCIFGFQQWYFGFIFCLV